MPAPGLIRRPWWTRERPDPGLASASLRFAATVIAVVLAAAVATWTLAPDSWQALIVEEQHTDATAWTVVSIWANNLLICCLPVLAGTFAHRLRRTGHRGWARLVLAVAAAGTLRSLLVIGLVGGLDPEWLATAAVWWIPEVSALGGCCAAGWRAFTDPDAERASRGLAHALAFAGALLAPAAFVEVALT